MTEHNSTPPSLPPALNGEGLEQLLETLNDIDATLDHLARLTRGRAPIIRDPAIPSVKDAAMNMVEALARLEARQVAAVEAIPHLEARRTSLEAAVQTAGEAYSSPEGKATRQRLEEERGATQVALEAARKHLTQLTTP